jgi:hypothetical protein
MFNEIESLIDEMIGNVGKIKQNRETNSVAVTEFQDKFHRNKPRSVYSLYS